MQTPPKSDLLPLDFVHIPASEFIIGSLQSADSQAEPDEMPQHRLTVSDFYIMRYPVTNAQYLQFVQATGYRAPNSWADRGYLSDLADHPVTGITLLDASRFCLWAASLTGLPIRLPSEPEWEKAARGIDGRIYPWGNKWEAGRCNSKEAGTNGTSPVGKFSPQGDSPYGIAEMGGNVQEWIVSRYGPYPYDPADGREEFVYKLETLLALPRFHETGATSNVNSLEAALDKSMLRGGSWREGRTRSRCAYRSWAAPLHSSDDSGFRCVYE
jgi:formylglycine-generating enzyme required for sulfatase activity